MQCNPLHGIFYANVLRSSPAHLQRKQAHPDNFNKINNVCVSCAGAKINQMRLAFDRFNESELYEKNKQ
jgi:hypothetical protein